MLVIVLSIMFVLFQSADVYSTYKTLSSGKGVEANPVMKYLMAKLGVLHSLVVTKIALAVILLVADILVPDATLYTLIGANTVYALVLWNNYHVMKDLGLF